jgi:hypothetical protein
MVAMWSSSVQRRSLTFSKPVISRAARPCAPREQEQCTPAKDGQWVVQCHAHTDLYEYSMHSSSQCPSSRSSCPIHVMMYLAHVPELLLLRWCELFEHSTKRSVRSLQPEELQQSSLRLVVPSSLLRAVFRTQRHQLRLGHA